jgi:hypothetical protein
MNPEERLIRTLLLQLIAEFVTNPLSAKTMRRFTSEAPAAFAQVGIGLLLESAETPGYRYLEALLVKQPAIFQALSSPWRLTREEAVTLGRRLMKMDPSFEVRFARQLPGRNLAGGPDILEGAEAARALDVLDEISSGRRMVQVLSHLMAHPDPRICAKTTLLIGRRIQNLSWTKRVVDE